MDAVPTIRFALGEGPESPRALPDSTKLVEECLRRNLTHINLDWNGMFTVGLPIEDDIRFLLEDYQTLLEAPPSSTWEQVIWLNDGTLVVKAKAVGESVTLDIAHTPHLHAPLREKRQVVTTDQEYRRGWHGMIADLIHVMESPDRH